jgi:hypothetical protein
MWGCGGLTTVFDGLSTLLNIEIATLILPHRLLMLYLLVGWLVGYCQVDSTTRKHSFLLSLNFSNSIRTH